MGGKSRAGVRQPQQSKAQERRPGAALRCKVAAAPKLREEYTGYCPLREGLHAAVERRMLASVDAKTFFDSYVSQRRPVVLEGSTAMRLLKGMFGLRRRAARWAKPGKAGTVCLASSSAGKCSVTVERRPDRGALFGQTDASQRETQLLSDFCRAMEDGSELGYLTTQPLPEDADGCPAALAAPHVLRLLRPARRLRPSLVGSMAPVQYNMWFGRSSDGASSGLHHDFHDNLYLLVRGQKEFRLFSPRCVDLLRPAGCCHGQPKLHKNGLICYARGVRDDGVPQRIADAWMKRSSTSAQPGSSTLSSKAVDVDADEDSLEQALDDAIAGFEEDDYDSSEIKKPDSSKEAVPELPDSFCAATTTRPETLPAQLRGSHLSAKLKAGDMLYLPASWFHEVISQGGDAGGHLALNVWLAPPHATASFESPYADNFWEEKYAKLRQAARPARKKRRLAQSKRCKKVPRRCAP
mmetsp:Transcript_69739/g.130212  ORF Transcript_69739/g.130212 Transcript_69739/m.130212 type:complete len:467 (+) Transcript_69739:23-1423(+)